MNGISALIKDTSENSITMQDTARKCPSVNKEVGRGMRCGLGVLPPRLHGHPHRSPASSRDPSLIKCRRASVSDAVTGLSACEEHKRSVTPLNVQKRQMSALNST